MRRKAVDLLMPGAEQREHGRAAGFGEEDLVWREDFPRDTVR